MYYRTYMPTILRTANSSRHEKSPDSVQLHQHQGSGIKRNFSLNGVQELADETGVPIVIHGSRQTGVSIHTGEPFTPNSDLDLGVVGECRRFAQHRRLDSGNPGRHPSTRAPF